MPGTCSDGVKNQGEAGVDCGGPCPAKCPGAPCANGDVCANGGACVDGICCDSLCAGGCEACTAAAKGSGPDGVCGPVKAGTDPKHACTSPTGDSCNGSAQNPACGCHDQVKDGAETGVDCGGSSVCGSCQGTCSDGARNQGESDVDCGGPCPACANGKTCGVAADCASGNCSGGTCKTACTPVSPCTSGVCGSLMDNCGNPVDCGNVHAAEHVRRRERTEPVRLHRRDGRAGVRQPVLRHDPERLRRHGHVHVEPMHGARDVQRRHLQLRPAHRGAGVRAQVLRHAAERVRRHGQLHRKPLLRLRHTCSGGVCSCSPLTAAQACGNQCSGTTSNGCGGSVTCTSTQCTAPDTCLGGTCGCNPLTQAQACGSQCSGSAPNGCGGSVGCTSSECTGSQVCNGSMCCTPLTAAQACGNQCAGTVPNGCGGSVSCTAAQCVAPNTCNGSVCACTPLTDTQACDYLDGECGGTEPDGCGGMVACHMSCIAYCQCRHDPHVRFGLALLRLRRHVQLS